MCTDLLYRSYKYNYHENKKTGWVMASYEHYLDH